LGESRTGREPILGALDHGSRSTDLGLSRGRGRLDVHNYGLLQVDQIVRGTRALMARGHMGRLWIDAAGVVQSIL
jgi:hypothetical protein